jgi:hypothetical protein
MFQLKYKDVGTTPLVPTLNKLCQMSVFDGRTAYRLHKIAEKCMKQWEKSGKGYDEIGAKYAKKDEQGTLVKGSNGHYIPEDEKAEEFGKEVEKFFDQTFEIPHKKIHVDQLSVRLSPLEMSALSVVIEGLDD